MARFELTDEEWAVIIPLLPKQGRGPERKDDRKLLNGIFNILRTGAPWRDLPDRYGSRTTVYNRYVRWSERGAGRVYLKPWLKSAKTLWFLSSLCLSIANGSREGRTNKVHAVVDAKGGGLS